MNCPLIQPKIELEEGEEMVRMGRCTEKECAWWVDTEKKCSITILALEASYKLWDRDRPKGGGF